MPRKATRPRYYPSRNAYFVCFQGKQHRLAEGPLCEHRGPSANGRRPPG
jgi:hypothetical protein